MNGRIKATAAGALLAAFAGGLAWAAGPQQEAPTSNQLLMRDKVNFANKALDGLATDNFDKIAESAKMLAMISRAASWHIIPTPEYTRMSKNFQEQAKDMERHAAEKNLDACSLDYMRITLTCVQCHRYMRETKHKKE